MPGLRDIAQLMPACIVAWYFFIMIIQDHFA
jgi:hypothetical protein